MTCRTHHGSVEQISDADFEFLQTVAALPRSPTLSEIAREYGYTRQWAWKKAERLRAAGYIEENDPGRRVWGVSLTHNGKLAIETAMGVEPGR